MVNRRLASRNKLHQPIGLRDQAMQRRRARVRNRIRDIHRKVQNLMDAAHTVPRGHLRHRQHPVRGIASRLLPVSTICLRTMDIGRQDRLAVLLRYRHAASRCVRNSMIRLTTSASMAGVLPTIIRKPIASMTTKTLKKKSRAVWVD